MKNKIFDLVKDGIPFNVNETANLLKRYGYLFMSWGCSCMSSVTVTEKTDFGTYAKGLLLTVNGMIHKGHVLITLNGSDLYDFVLLNKQYNPVGEKQTDIYFDDLFDQIDRLVERIPEYVR